MLLAFEPHTGFRYVEVRQRRTAVDYAQFMQCLLPQHYAHVEYIRWVQDKLNTHTPGSFYEVLVPEEAFALSQRFEVHYTPKKGSWLNMAEIELSATKICGTPEGSAGGQGRAWKALAPWAISRSLTHPFAQGGLR